MKTLFVSSLLLAVSLFSGCETVVETRRPARYDTVYAKPGYRDRRPDYYYRDGRRYQRDVVVVNRPVIVEPRVYSRSRDRVVIHDVNPRNRRNIRQDDRRDHRKDNDRDDRKDRDKKKKKDRDNDDR